MASQQAWQVHRLGPPHRALRLVTVEIRPPRPGGARVAVDAIGLNHPDLLLCAGKYQQRPDLPFSPGFEATGVVVEAGPDSRHRVGERVIVVPELPSGAFQQMLTVPDGQLFPVSDDVPPQVAAVLHIAYATAHAALHRRAALRSDETLIVSGAAGGVGLAAVQIGRAAGARVIALASGSSKVAACRAAGADVTVDLDETGELVERLRDLTGGRGADVVIDVVGGALFQQLRRAVAFEGRLVTVGFTSSQLPDLPVNHALLRNYSLVGLNLGLYRHEAPETLREIHDAVVAMYTNGLIDPVIHRALPFSEAPEALELLASRSAIGRVVLTT